MERHDTHALSYSSSEEHSYQFDRNLSTRNFQSENKYFTKEEEKNDWTNIFINSFKEMKNSIGLGDLCNFNDISQSGEIIEKIKDIKDMKKSNKNSKDILKDKIKEKSKNKSKDKSKDKGKDKSDDKTKDKSKDKSKDKNKDKKKDKNKDKIKDKIKNIEKDKNFKIITLKNSEKIQDKYKSKTKNNSPATKNKKEIKEEKTKNEKKEKSEKKEKQKDKFTVLENGIVVKQINQQKEDDENEISNEEKIKKMKDNIIKEYFSHYNNIKNPMIIKKPHRGFITKINRHKSRRKDRFKTKNFIKKGTHNNIQTPSLGNYNKLSLKTGQSTYSNNDMKRQNAKSRTILINRNQNNLNKLDDKFSSLSTITAKKLAINNNSNLFFSGNISNKNNIVKKRPLSSYNIIKKEIDINLKSSKLESSFYNKSFSIQKTGQISSIINVVNINHKNKNKRKKIIYENKNFLKDLKDLKNAFELSDNNIIISNNNKNSDLNINTFSERTNKTNKTNKILTKHNSENNNIDAFSIKTRKLNSAKVRGKSYEYFYPRDPTPLFIEFNNRQNDNNEIKIQNENNVCNKCGYKRHFGSEKDCPICINMKEKNKLKEKKLSNLNYYYPFKDKNSTTNSIHNSFRNNNSNNSHKIKQIINHDSFINFINIKLENMLPMDYYFNPFFSNSIHTTLNKKKRVRMNSAKQIRGDKSNIYNKYNALHKYFE